MSKRADAHIHLFEGGYKGGSFADRPGVGLDEAACYHSLAQQHHVDAAMVVGFAGEPWAANNNDYIARMARQYAWVRPLAYVDLNNPPDIAALSRWRKQGFVGLSFYVLDQSAIDALHWLPDELWSFLVDHNWLVSVNSRDPFWSAWQRILDRYGNLRLLVSHLGLPLRVHQQPTLSTAERALAGVLQLAQYPGLRVKLSGFYALTDPGHDFPHTAAWRYVEALLNRLGADRLLWGSDFTPCLDQITFPQTLGLFSKMPFFSEPERQSIEGNNLIALLDECL